MLGARRTQKRRILASESIQIAPWRWWRVAEPGYRWRGSAVPGDDDGAARGASGSAVGGGVASTTPMGECSAVAPRSCLEANRMCLFDPLLDAYLITVQSSLTFNCGEFAIIKIWIEDGLPNAKELHCIPVSEPR